MDDQAQLKVLDLRDLTQEQLDAIGLAFTPPLPTPATAKAILAHQRAHGAFLSSFFPFFVRNSGTLADELMCPFNFPYTFDPNLLI